MEHSESMPQQPCSAIFLVEEETPFFVKVRQRTVISRVEMCARTPLPKGTYCVWAATLPVPSRVSADQAYAEAPPYVVGSVVVGECERELKSEHTNDANPTTRSLALSRWEVQAGTTLMLHVAAANAQPAAVAAALSSTQRRARNYFVRPRRQERKPPALLEPTLETELSPLVTVRLCGALDPEEFADDQAEWIPFLGRRWFELASADLQEATLVFRPSAPPTVEGRSIVSEEAAKTYHSLLVGGVKEASGVDVDGEYVKWADGSIGLMAEVKPYIRVFTPARPDKVVRVRRFPHRHADVVGELAFHARAVAIGRKTDPFTGENYALLVLPNDDSLRGLVDLYGLRSLSPSQWLWGWSKIAGAGGGVPLLKDVTVDTDAQPTGLQPLQLACPQRLYGKSPAAVSPTILRTPLPTPTFYTATRPTKEVRIRRKPSLKSEVIGEVEPNEVKEAICEVTVPAAASATGRMTVPGSRKRDRHQTFHASAAQDDNGAAASATSYVEWKSGGFSVLRNDKGVFLRQMALRAEPGAKHGALAARTHEQEREGAP